MLGRFVVKGKKVGNRNRMIIAVALIFFLTSVSYIVYYYSIQKKAEITYELLQEENQDFVEKEIPVDFLSIQKQNPDAYAWIIIPETQINYPIMQSGEDDIYYLNHTFERIEGLPGSIYTEKANSKEFTDNNTVIYGHNMKNGTMFAELRGYSDEAFLKKHPYVYIYTPTKSLKYQVFAVYITNNQHILRSHNFEDDSVYENYLDEIFKRNSLKNMKSDVTVSNKIITLSTCDGNSKERWVVQAYLVEDN